jgi:hypothetical protein
MALKGDRHELETDVSFFMNETGVRGQFVSISTAGSGSAMDDSNSLVTIAATASGAYAIGCLLNDVVNIDLTRQHLNWHKDEVQKGSKVTILKRGFIVTNCVNGTPSAGRPAYLGDAGVVSADRTGSANAKYSDVVGQFLSVKDADGYVKVELGVIPDEAATED